MSRTYRRIRLLAHAAPVILAACEPTKSGVSETSAESIDYSQPATLIGFTGAQGDPMVLDDHGGAFGWLNPVIPTEGEVVEPPVHAISSNGTIACAIDTRGVLSCWGWHDYGNDGSRLVWTNDDIPEGPWEELECGNHRCCALHEGGTEVVCMTTSFAADEELVVYSVPALAGLSVTGDGFCGIKESDSSIVCDGPVSTDQLVAPLGAFISVVTGPETVCGLTSSGEAVCTGGRVIPDEASARTEPLVALSARMQCLAGLDAGGTVWAGCHRDALGEQVGIGMRSIFNLGDLGGCGILADSDEVSCWGDAVNVITPGPPLNDDEPGDWVEWWYPPAGGFGG